MLLGLDASIWKLLLVVLLVDFHAKLTRGFQSKLTHPRFG